MFFNLERKIVFTSWKCCNNHSLSTLFRSWGSFPPTCRSSSPMSCRRYTPSRSYLPTRCHRGCSLWGENHRWPENICQKGWEGAVFKRSNDICIPSIRNYPTSSLLISNTCITAMTWRCSDVGCRCNFFLGRGSTWRTLRTGCTGPSRGTATRISTGMLTTLEGLCCCTSERWNWK